ncbi:MAG: formate dehydrogenase accessory protein FdhE, partial [Chloroflexota bacterium]
MAEDRLRARIATLAAAEPALAEGLALRGAMLEILDHAPVSLPELRLPADLVRARLAAGVPLLNGLDFPLPAAVADLLQRLAVAMLADPDARQPAETILRALERHRLHAEQLIGEAVVGHQDHLVALADGAEVSSALVETLADLAARPLLAQVARRLQPALALSAWTRSYCPICGARPIRAEGAQQAAGAASLRCGRCTT